MYSCVVLFGTLAELCRLPLLFFVPAPALRAEVVFLRKQLAMFAERVRKYLPLSDPRRRRRPPADQTWRTFMKNQARAIAACDFVSVKTLGMKTLYVFVVMHIETRRILHVNLTAHPTAAWTSQQLREAIPNDSGIKHLVHDGAGMFNGEFKQSAKRLGVASLRTPPYAPQANSFCERLIGTTRRALLDWIISLSENHLRVLLHLWASHYNRGRPHMSLGPGVPEPSEGRPAVKLAHRHQLPDDAQLVSTPVLGGLRHEYRFEKLAA